jgi:hypothetical protein
MCVVGRYADAPGAVEVPADHDLTIQVYWNYDTTVLDAENHSNGLLR